MVVQIISYLSFYHRCIAGVQQNIQVPNVYDIHVVAGWYYRVGCIAGVQQNIQVP
jgi:hypothetical protein